MGHVSALFGPSPNPPRPNHSEATKALVASYGHAITDGDALDTKVEQRLLRALVAESATGAADFYGIRNTTDPSATEVLDDLAARLRGGDVAGRTINAIYKQVLSRARETVFSVVIHGVLPAWLTIAVAWFAGLLSHSEATGYAFGLVLGTALLVSVPLSIQAARAAAANGAAWVEFFTGFGELLATPGRLAANLGKPADAVFATHIGPTLATNPALAGAAKPDVTAKARFVAGFAAVVTYGVGALVAIYFVTGMFAGLGQAWAQYACTHGQMASQACADAGIDTGLDIPEQPPLGPFGD